MPGSGTGTGENVIPSSQNMEDGGSACTVNRSSAVCPAKADMSAPKIVKSGVEFSVRMGTSCPLSNRSRLSGFPIPKKRTDKAVAGT